MDAKVNEISINGVTYVPKGSSTAKAEVVDWMKYCIVRTDTAGVFAGYIKKKEGKEVTIVNARRIFFWSWAASLSQLAIDGVSKPKECKFPEEVSEIVVTEAIEIIEVTEKARISINSVPVWKV